MNNLLNAEEAARKSVLHYAQKIMEEANFQAQQKAKEKEKQKARDLDFKKRLDELIIYEINNGVKYGKNSAQIILKEYWNIKETESFEFDKIVKEKAKELKAKGYEVYYGQIQTYHDTSFDYLNSGGECGSSEPYYVDRLGLNIHWDKKA